MKQTAMLKFTLLVLVVVALFVGGCVDVNNPDVQAFDFRASVRFANFSNVGGASMVVKVDRSSATAATATYRAASSYVDLPAGARFFSFAYGGTTDTLHQALTPYTQYTLYSQGNATTRSYYVVTERRTLPGTVPYASGMQEVRFINLSDDTSATVAGGLTFHLLYGTKDTTTDALTYPGISDYYSAAASSNPKYMIVGAAGDTLKTATAVGTGAGRFTVVFSGTQAGGGWVESVFKEN